MRANSVSRVREFDSDEYESAYKSDEGTVARRWKKQSAIAILIPLRDYFRVPSLRRVNLRRRQKSGDLIERSAAAAVATFSRHTF